MQGNLKLEQETFDVRGAVFEVYKTLGSGFLEEVYQNALEEELKLRKIPFVAKKELHIDYKGRDCGVYIPDFICFDKVIVEIKAVDSLHDRHVAQVMNYLYATGFELGLLVNFGAYPKVDIRRLVVGD